MSGNKAQQREPIRVQIEGLDELRDVAREFRAAAAEMRHAAELAQWTAKQVPRQVGAAINGAVASGGRRA